jgi:hypothetical protein
MSVWQTASVTNSDIDVLGALYHGRTGLPPASYFNNALPGCGSLVLTASGVPELYGTVTLSLSGVQGVPYLGIGLSVPPITLCSGCQLGIDLSTALILQTSTFTTTIPCEPALIGLSLGVQGLEIGGPGGCVGGGPAFSLSNEIIVTIL